MKKKILLCLTILLAMIMIVGCGKSSKERTIEYLLDRYIDAYSNADMDAVKDIFPPFYIDYSKDVLTKEKIEKDIKEAKEYYGDDYKITYKVGNKTKMTDEELEKLNDNMINTYNAKEKATECYKYEVSIMFKESKKEDPESMTTMGYCKYDNLWYIVSIY